MHHATPFLFPRLLLMMVVVYSACGGTAAEHQCGLDEVRSDDSPWTAMIRELPRKGESGLQTYIAAAPKEGSGWAPIRIAVSTEDLDNPEKYCGKAGEKRPDFQGGVLLCTQDTIFTAEKKLDVVNRIIPTAVKLHTERLFVQPLKSRLIVPSFSGNSVCKYFTIPDDHHKTGVNADMVLYVAAGLGKVFGLPCVLGGELRPTAGAMNYPPRRFGGLRLNSRLAAHEIGHALGFVYDKLKALNMLDSATVRAQKPHVVRINSELVLEKAKEHFNCSTLDGVELELTNYSGGGEVHWPRFTAKDELMAVPMVTSAHHYTALTLAVFESMKFYRVNFELAEPMRWGRDAGCPLLSGSCVEDDSNIGPEKVCKGGVFRCTSDRYGIGQCKDVDYNGNSKQKQRCRTVEVETFKRNKIETVGLCSEDLSMFFPSMLSGTSDSWCLDGEGLPAASGRARGLTPVEGVCVRVRCETEKGMVSLKFFGDDTWHECLIGGSMAPGSPNVTREKIKCPKYEDVCTVAADGRSVAEAKHTPEPKGDMTFRCGAFIPVTLVMTVSLFFVFLLGA